MREIIIFYNQNYWKPFLRSILRNVSPATLYKRFGLNKPRQYPKNMFRNLFFLVTLLAVAFAAIDDQKQVKILKQEQEVRSNGYRYAFETDDGTKAEQEGELKVIDKDLSVGVSKGNYAYTADDGNSYSVSFVADENGYQPQGEHLPVAPEIPPLIRKALEYAAAHPEPEEKLNKHWFELIITYFLSLPTCGCFVFK